MSIKYITLNNRNCEFDSKTGMWRFKLPDDFVNSRSNRKYIKLLNFMFYCATIPRNDSIYTNVDYTTLHSPTMCDGNYNQDYYIATLCYTYNTYHKVFPIKSQPQYLEFFFRDSEQEIHLVHYFPPGASGYEDTALENRFTIDLELGY